MSDETDAQARARVGDVLNDKWTLERLLGAGGMGAVYAGRHRNGAKAAVKVLHHALSQHLEVRARFLREGYAANRVDRPGVVKVLDDDIVVGGRDDGTAYLVMELLEGQSLEGRIVSGWAITERQFLALADAVLDVLDAAHNNGVVHRDIKPDNIFIAIDDAGVERVKLLDFGLARLLEGRSTTSHGIAIGTPSFMSPEQAGGRNQEIDGRTDLFALAASGFRVITGRRIHEAVSPIEVMAKMATIPAPRIQTIAPMVSSVFARIIDRALEFNREDRYETAALMRSDVQNAMAALDMGLAVPGPPVASTGERSIELSVKDFELSKAVSVPEPIFLVPSLDLPLPPQQAVVPPEEARPSVSSAPKTLINAPSVGPTSPKSPSMPSASVPVTTRDPVAPPDALEVTSTPPEVTSTPLEVTSTPLEVTSTPPGVTSTPPGVTSTPPGVTSTPLGVPAAASEAKLTVLSFGPSAGRVPSAPENAPSPPYEAPSTALGGQVSALLLLSTSPEVPSEGAPLPFAPPPAKSHAPADASPSQSLSPESHRESIDAPASMSDSPPVRAEAPPMHTALEPHYPEESLAEIPLQRAPIMPVAVVAGILVVGAAVGLYAASRSPGTGSSVAPGSSGLDVTMELDGAPVDAEAATRDAGPDAGAAGEVSPGAGVQRDASPAKPRGWPPHTPPRGHMPPPKPVKHPTH